MAVLVMEATRRRAETPRSTWGRLLRLIFVILVIEQVARFAVEVFADGFEGREADGFGFACFQDGEVLRSDADGGSEFVQPHFSFRHHDVQVNNDWHVCFLI
jgi:hypothetical protein